jgi:hypothetical protein
MLLKLILEKWALIMWELDSTGSRTVKHGFKTAASFFSTATTVPLAQSASVAAPLTSRWMERKHVRLRLGSNPVPTVTTGNSRRHHDNKPRLMPQHCRNTARLCVASRRKEQRKKSKRKESKRIVGKKISHTNIVHCLLSFRLKASFLG